MNKDEFLRELEYLLGDVAQEEREEALQYYRDYFEEAGPEREAEIVAHLGSPARVAAQIRDGLEGNADAGEFTERGYSDARYEEASRVPDQYAEVVSSGRPSAEEEEFQGDYWKDDRRSRRQYERRRREEGGEARRESYEKRRSGLLMLLLFVFFGLPLAGTIISGGFSILAAVIGVLFGIFGGLFSLVIGAFAAAFGLLVSGVVMIVNGCLNMAVPAIGTMAIALGFFLLAGAMLMTVLGKWGCTTAVPGVLRLSIELVRRLAAVVVGIVRRIFGRGGAGK